MPINRSDYPEDWEEISLEVRKKADFRCQDCGAENGTVIYRERGSARWTPDLEEARRMFAAYGYYRSEVQIGVAHLGIPKPDGTPGDKADTMDCRRENLRALCRRCHLAFDLPENVVNRRLTRLRRFRERIESAGQMRLRGFDHGDHDLSA